MSSFMNEKVVPKLMAFINTKAMQALKDGLLYSMPMMIIGAIFLLIANFPIPAFTEWLANTGITPVLNQAYGSTFNMMALIASIGIAYTYVKNDGYQGLPAGVISLCCYLILQPQQIVNEAGETADVIFKTWTAGQGMIGALLMGLIVGWIYTIFMEKDITIKMPAGVPEGVSQAFVALIPGAVIIIAVTIIYAIFTIAAGTTPMEWIYKVIQTPLQGMTDSIGGVIGMGFLIPFFWFFGVPGAGLTIGLVMYLFFFAKSAQLKEIGKLGIAPAFFNINEPVLFGVPVVLNPLLAVPFMLMPVISGLIQYAALYTGICPLYAGVIVPWTTPPIISGFLIGGVRTAILQLLILVLSFFVYLPFIRVIDKQYVAQEKNAQ